MTTDIVQEKITKLKNSKKSSQSLHYFFRRLPIVGVTLFLPALLVMLFTYLAMPKDTPFDVGAFHWVQAVAIKHSAVISTTYIAAIVAVLIFTFGAFKEVLRKLLLNLVVLLLSLVPFLLPINEVAYRIMFFFFWGVMLTLLSWQINRNFGYTRIWARSEHYLQLFAIIEYEKSAGLLDADAANNKIAALLVSLEKEIYADTVGDTFHLWERITKG